MNRREFVGTLGAATLGTATGLIPPARRLPAVGLQLYTVRKLLARNWSRTLEQIAAIGYRELEFAGYFGQPPADIRRLLDSNGLKAPAGHFDRRDLLAPSSAPFDTAATMGHSWLVVAWVPPAERRTLDDWRRIADELNRIGERCRKAGLRFAYHNHDFEFAPIDGKLPYDILLEESDPELVRLEIDLYWVTKGGQDANGYLSRTAGRTGLVHVKESAGPPAHNMVNVGAGALDWKALLKTAWWGGVRHFFVEHDDPANPLAFCRASYAYLSYLEF